MSSAKQGAEQCLHHLGMNCVNSPREINSMTRNVGAVKQEAYKLQRILHRQRELAQRAFSSRSRQTYLSTGAGEGAGISGSAHGSSLPHIILQPEGGRTVSSKVFVRLPRLAEVLGALQHHGGRPGRLKDQNQVSEVEGGFQVQPDGLF